MPGGPWSYRFWHAEKKRWETVSTKTRVERVARSIARSAALAYMEQRDVAAGGDWNLADAVDDCLSARFPVEPKIGEPTWDTWRDARNRLKCFASFVGDVDIHACSEDDFTGLVQRFLNQRRKNGKSATSIHNNQRAVSRFCSWALGVRPKKVSWKDNPASAKHLPELPPLQTRAKPPADREKVMTLLLRCRGLSLYPAIVLCLSGLRPRGASRVAWEDIDLHRRRVRVLEKNVERYIPLSAWAAGELAWTSNQWERPTGRVWPHHPWNLFRAMRREAKRAGVRGLTLQALRRTATTRLWAAGVPPQLAAKIMGHSVKTAEKHYVQVAALNADGAVKALDWGGVGEKTVTKTVTVGEA